jgi:hypothetical protein
MRAVRPRRASHTYRQHLKASPDRVFQLLCPVRECDWVPGWAPELVVSESGFAENDCIFVTADADRSATWYVTRHEPESFFVEMIRIIPGFTASRVQIDLCAEDGGCAAHVSYRHTSLGPEGDAFVAGFTSPRYEQFMRQWESRLNHYLQTGQMLTPEEPE